MSCLSETVAVSLIGAERLEMPRGALHDLLTAIWSDEVGHARFGWRVVREHVGSLSAPARARLDAYLVVAFAHLERHELSHLPLIAPPAEALALGVCNGADARSLFYDTLETVIVLVSSRSVSPARVRGAKRVDLAPRDGAVPPSGHLYRDALSKSGSTGCTRISARCWSMTPRVFR